MKFLIWLVTTIAVVAVLAAWVFLPWSALIIVVAIGLVALGATSRGRQALQIARLGVGTLRQRLGASLVIFVGIAGVVGVLVALQAMAIGFQATFQASGNAHTAIVLSSGSDSEIASGIDRSSIPLIDEAPGIAKDSQGRPIASPEIVVVASLKNRINGAGANLEVRGVGPEVWHIYSGLKIIKGRRFKPGLRELIVGEGAEKQFSGLGIGQRVLLGQQPWTIVGVFKSRGANDSELWGDNETVASAFRRDAFSSVVLQLESPNDLGRVNAWLAGNPELRVKAETTKSYYAQQSKALTMTIKLVGVAVALIMAIGAIFGALNTMYAAVESRAREISTLRAIGFEGATVVIAVLLEALALAFLGGTAGALAAWLVFHGYTVSTVSSSFNQVVFKFAVTPELMLTGLRWALAIGLLGGVFPALRAARTCTIRTR